MKKTITAVALALLVPLVLSLQAAAYIERGTVHISADTADIHLLVGESYELPVTIDPAESQQTTGCGMADCPERCGANCLSREGNCTCDDTSLKTYYPEVQLKKLDEQVASAVYEDGTVRFTGVGAGSCTVNIAVRMREYTGSSIEVNVTVEEAPAPTPTPLTAEADGMNTALIVGVCAAVLVIAAGTVVFVRNRKH